MMKARIVQEQNGSISKNSLLYEGIEMAKQEVATNLWYNMNIKRIHRLVSFCMDYLRYQREGCAGVEEESMEFPCTSFTCHS